MFCFRVLEDGTVGEVGILPVIGLQHGDGTTSFETLVFTY